MAPTRAEASVSANPTITSWMVWIVWSGQFHLEESVRPVTKGLQARTEDQLRRVANGRLRVVRTITSDLPPDRICSRLSVTTCDMDLTPGIEVK
jgi:hypothetical protein